MQWGVRVRTRSATSTGFRTSWIEDTQPNDMSVPFITMASISTSPAALRKLPLPASNVGSSSRDFTAASTAGTAKFGEPSLFKQL